MRKVAETAEELNFEMELNTARIQIESPNKKVFVVGVAAHGDEVTMASSVSLGTTRRDAACFIDALEREIARIKQMARL